MSSKQYSFFIGILCLFASGSFAQVGTTTSYDVLDSSLISKRNLPQHNQFVNNAYPFPAKPKNQWEIGVKGGLFTISGDVPAVFPTAGFGVHVRKALGYVFSLRLEYMYGIGKGLNWKPRNGGYSDPWLNAGYAAPTVIYDNYKTKLQDLSIEGVATLNNIRFHKARSNFLVYALAGIGATLYDVKVDTKNNSNANYNFSGVGGGVYKDRKTTRQRLKDLGIGDSYESAGETDGTGQRTLLGNNFTPSASFGMGVAFRLGKRVNLALEDRLSVVISDLLDGQRWQNASTVGNRILSPSKDNYNFATVGLNFNLGSKAT